MFHDNTVRSRPIQIEIHKPVSNQFAEIFYFYRIYDRPVWSIKENVAGGRLAFFPLRNFGEKRFQRFADGFGYRRGYPNCAAGPPDRPTDGPKTNAETRSQLCLRHAGAFQFFYDIIGSFRH
jgi:hypothetical protein